MTRAYLLAVATVLALYVAACWITRRVGFAGVLMASACLTPAGRLARDQLTAAMRTDARCSAMYATIEAGGCSGCAPAVRACIAWGKDRRDASLGAAAMDAMNAAGVRP